MVAGETVSIDLDVLIGLMICSAGIGAVLVHGGLSILRRWRFAREHKRAEHSLSDKLRKGDLSRGIDVVAARPAFEPARALHGPETLVRARVDHMREVQRIWGSGTREQALEQVASIMRRSIRSPDRQTGLGGDIINEVKGDGFTILMRGAEEKDAGGIAKRLRKALSRSRIDSLADNLRLTASFGLAERRPGESYSMWHARAEAALNVARARGDDQIVEAAMAEEVILLPPPSANAGATKAA